MQMPSKRPIQMDQLPEEYDQKKAQRVVESVVRRLTDEPKAEAPSASASKSLPAQEDPLPWIV